METISFRVSSSLKARLDDQAKQQGLSCSDYVRDLLEAMSTEVAAYTTTVDQLTQIAKSHLEQSILLRFLVQADPNTSAEDKSKVMGAAKDKAEALTCSWTREAVLDEGQLTRLESGLAEHSVLLRYLVHAHPYITRENKLKVIAAAKASAAAIGEHPSSEDDPETGSSSD